MAIDVDDVTIYGVSRLIKDNKYFWVVWCVNPESVRCVRHGMRTGQREAQVEAELVAMEVRKIMDAEDTDFVEEFT